MAKAMSKSQTAQALVDGVKKATGVEVKKKVASGFLVALANIAYKEAKNTFTIPGIGKLVLVKRPARKMIMRFGPKAGQEIMVPEKKVVKFRVAKAAKDAILGKK
jgi:DNA-binding protein HU-beta